MRPSEPSIREVLRREAAQVQIPEGMWDQISRRMDQENELAEARRRRLGRHGKWKPFFAFAAAAGVFWLTVAPLGPQAETSVPEAPAQTNSLVSTIEPDRWGARQAQNMKYRTESAEALPLNSRVLHMYYNSR